MIGYKIMLWPNKSELRITCYRSKKHKFSYMIDIEDLHEALEDIEAYLTQKKSEDPWHDTSTD